MVKSITILLVDDDDEDIEIFTEVIHKEFSNSYSIVTSNNGLECLQLLQSIRPDIIFLDINMPKMGGRECLQKIKSDNDFKNIPVVIYSTTKNQNEIDELKKLGASYLSKPVSFNDFVLPLKSILSEYIS